MAMSKEISAKNVFIYCDCGKDGCAAKCSASDAFKKTAKKFEEVQKKFQATGLAIHMIKEMIGETKEQKNNPDNSNVSILLESLCADIKLINERLDKLEVKEHPQVMVCCTKDVKQEVV
jgi:hypothetical protein